MRREKQIFFPSNQGHLSFSSSDQDAGIMIEMFAEVHDWVNYSLFLWEWGAYYRSSNWVPKKRRASSIRDREGISNYMPLIIRISFLEAVTYRKRILKH
jgi:hypothetical protein